MRNTTEERRGEDNQFGKEVSDLGPMADNDLAPRMRLEERGDAFRSDGIEGGVDLVHNQEGQAGGEVEGNGESDGNEYALPT